MPGCAASGSSRRAKRTWVTVVGAGGGEMTAAGHLLWARRPVMAYGSWVSISWSWCISLARCEAEVCVWWGVGVGVPGCEPTQGWRGHFQAGQRRTLKTRSTSWPVFLFFSDSVAACCPT